MVLALALVFALTVKAETQTGPVFGGLSARMPRAEPGEALFEKHCASCHQSDGMGFESSPPLAASSWVTGPETRLIRIVLHGVRGPIPVGDKTYNMEMPGFGKALTDEDIASLLSFVRRRWGGPSPAIAADTVRRVRAATRNRTDYWKAEELLEEP